MFHRIDLFCRPELPPALPLLHKATTYSRPIDIMASSVDSKSSRENWFDSLLNMVEKAIADLFDDDTVGKKSTQADEATTSKLELPIARGFIGRTAQAQRQKNRLSKYLNLIPAKPQTNTPKKRRKTNRALHEKRISHCNEESRQSEGRGTLPQVPHEVKPFEEAEFEIPDDASEITLPVSLRNNLFGIDFTPKKKFDDVEQPELETRRLAMILERKEKGLPADATSDEQSAPIHEETSPTAHASIFPDNDALKVYPKTDERDSPQSQQRSFEEQSSARDLGEDLSLSNPCSRDLGEDLRFSNPSPRDLGEDLQFSNPPSRDLAEHLQFSNATIRILNPPTFEVTNSPKNRTSDKYAPFQAKALDISRKEMKLRCLDKNSSTWIPGTPQETTISSPVLAQKCESEEISKHDEAKETLAYTPPVADMERATVEQHEQPRQGRNVDASNAMCFPPGKVVVLQPGSLRL